MAQITNLWLSNTLVFVFRATALAFFFSTPTTSKHSS